MIKDNIIKNKIIMYVYVETINQLEAEEILDVGMFYKAIGAVSRAVLNAEVPQMCRITGVTTDDTEGLGIYEKIYDEIITYDDFKSKLSGSNKKYDLIVLLGAQKKFLLKNESEEFAESIIGMGKHILAYCEDEEVLSKYGEVKAIEYCGESFIFL